jgi:hypothetical protein
MRDAAVGRLLVASLHQAIADVLPTRLEFYESWLNTTGLRDGKIGLAPLAAVLSFLRLEGELYPLVAQRAGEYAAEWRAAELGSVHRSLVRAAPPAIRARLVMRIARGMVHRTYSGSRALVRWRRGRGEVDIRGSVFCEVRDPVAQPLCVFYASAIRRLMQLFQLEADVETDRCRAAGGGHCVMSLLVRPVGAAG